MTRGIDRRLDSMVALNRNHPPCPRPLGRMATQTTPGCAEIISLRLTMSNAVWIARMAFCVLLLSAGTGASPIRRAIRPAAAPYVVEEALDSFDQFGSVPARA